MLEVLPFLLSTDISSTLLLPLLSHLFIFIITFFRVSVLLSLIKPFSLSPILLRARLVWIPSSRRLLFDRLVADLPSGRFAKNHGDSEISFTGLNPDIRSGSHREKELDIFQ
jgi:hypothetical protein